MDGVKVALPADEEVHFCGELIRELLGMRWSRAAVYQVNGDAEKHATGSGGVSALTNQWLLRRSPPCSVTVPGHWPWDVSQCL